MFATHYHLLTDELKTNPQIANYNMACVVDEHQVSQTAHLSHTHTHTDRQTDRQTHTHTHTHHEGEEACKFAEIWKREGAVQKEGHRPFEQELLIELLHIGQLSKPCLQIS